MALRSSATADTLVDLTCPVCLDTFIAPRFLPCHHTLCTECISDLMERGMDTGHFRCPKCHVQVKIPDEGVESFQVNFYLAPLLSGRVTINTTENCQACSRKASVPIMGPAKSQLHADSSVSPAVAKCQQCQEALCRSCIEEHLKHQKYSNHKFITLVQNSESLSKSGISCFDHADWDSISFFCHTCSDFVCRACRLVDHPDHMVVEATPEVDNQRSEIRRQLMSLTTFRGALADVLDDGTRRAEEVIENCQDVLNQLDSSSKLACQAVTSRVQTTSQNLKKARDRVVQLIQADQKQVQNKMAEVSTLEDQSHNLLIAGDAEFVQNKQKLSSKIQSLMSKVPPCRNGLIFDFKTSSEIETLLRREGNLGYITVKFNTPIVRHKLSLSPTKQHRKLRKICQRADGCVLVSVGNCLVELAEDFTETKRHEFPGEITDFVPFSDGSIFVALPFPYPVQILRPDGQAGDFVSPLNPPSAMAMTDKQELVMAAHDGRELSLTFYSLSGSRSKRITIPKPDFTPTSMAMTKRGQVYLCSSGRELVCLDADFSELGGMVNAKGFQPISISSLRGVGSGVGDVLVAELASRNVEVVELRGNKLQRGTPLIIPRGAMSNSDDESREERQKLCCSFVDKSGRLWVGEEDGHVVVYDWLMRMH